MPDIGEAMADWLFADHYARPGLDYKTRKIVSVASLASLGSQTKVQLALNIRKALKAGASKTELAEAIWQIGIYAGTPAAIAALDTLKEVLAEDAPNT